MISISWKIRLGSGGPVLDRNRITLLQILYAECNKRPKYFSRHYCGRYISVFENSCVSPWLAHLNDAKIFKNRYASTTIMPRKVFWFFIAFGIQYLQQGITFDKILTPYTFKANKYRDSDSKRIYFLINWLSPPIDW